MPVPLLMVSDAITAPTGLGRITRELAVRIHEHLSKEFRVGVCGYGGTWSRQFDFAQYPITRLENWAIPELPVIWKDFAGSEKGVIFFVWNASWLPWVSNPDLLTEGSDLRTFLKSGRFEKWLYAPVDAEGPNGKLHTSQRDIMKKFDRLATYTKWASGVIDRTLYEDSNIHSDIPVTPYLPHGTDTSIFMPRNRQEARLCFIDKICQESGGKRRRLSDEVLLLGVIATNTARKDWPIAFQVCKELIDRGEQVGLWAHTDGFQKSWDLPALADEFGMKDRVIFTNSHLSNEALAWGISACNVTLGIGSGEGWGLPLSESLACGVPVIHGKYAGGAEFIPDQFLVPAAAWRYEGYYLNKRPVFNPHDWANKVQLANGVRAALSPEYTWDHCWPKWAEWLKNGLK
jgi:glycosyltransferase involved in cell wall biosynthesis